MTMVKVIRFEIADFQNGTIAEFIVENSPENWELIAGSRVTRGISFDQMLDFQFEKEEMIPAGFISPEIWAAMVQTDEFLAELAIENGETPVIEEIAPEIPEAIEEIALPVAEKVIKKNYYGIYECIGTTKKQIRTVTSQKLARVSISELRSMNPSRKYKWAKI
jgi:hypothetical protein